MDYGTLRVATPDGQIREFPITDPSVVIGRADGNQVVIDHVSVSRRHAQLVIESSRVTIQDMGSGTGTFVGSQRIPANTPTLVESGQSMRFGDVEARFTFAEALSPSDPGASEAPETEQTIGVSLASPSQPVAAGSPTTATVNIQNRGNVVDEVTIAIVDLPPGWVKISRPTMSLVPGARDEVTVVIQPPKDSSAAAGDYAFSVAVTSKVHGREVRALGKLSVRAFEGFQIALEPWRAKRDFHVTATNNGNVPLTVALSATDEAREFGYTFDAETLELAPGEARRVGMKVKPKGRKLFGASVNRPFKVEARQAGSSAAASTADGQLIIKPPLERFKLPTTIVGALALFGVLAYQANRMDLFGGGGGSSPDPTPTVAAASASAAPGATATPTGLYVGGNGLIANSDPVPTNTNCLAVRSSATRNDTNILGRLCTGEKVAIQEGPTSEGGFTWWRIQAPNGLSGWAAEKSADGALPFIVPTP